MVEARAIHSAPAPQTSSASSKEEIQAAITPALQQALASAFESVVGVRSQRRWRGEEPSSKRVRELRGDRAEFCQEC